MPKFLGPAQKLTKGVKGQPLQHQNLASRYQRLVDLEGGILGGGSDKNDGAVLDEGQHGVLLCLVEAMDFIDKQQCAKARGTPRTGPFEDLPEIRHTGKHGRYGIECEIDPFGDEPGNGGLAGSRRPPEDHRGKASLGNHATKRTILLQQMVLANDILQRRRTHAVGQWSRHFVFKKTRQAPAPSSAGGMPWCTVSSRNGNRRWPPATGSVIMAS